MLVDSATLASLISRRFDEKISEQARLLAQGAAGTFDEYRHRTGVVKGYVQGLDVAINALRELTTDEEDDDNL